MIVRRYRMVAFNGVRLFSGDASAGVEMCSLLACLNETLSSCGESNNEIKTPTFQSLKIEMPVDKDDRDIHLPLTFTTDFVPLNASYFSINRTDDDNGSKVAMSLTRPVEKLHSFVIFGRDFSDDGLRETAAYK